MKLLRDFNENRNCFSGIPLLLLLYVGTHYSNVSASKMCRLPHSPLTTSAPRQNIGAPVRV